MSPEIVRVACGSAFSAALGVAAYLVADNPESALGRWARRYMRGLDRQLQALLLRPQAARIAGAQALALFVVGSLTVVDGVRPWAPVILLLVALLPALALRRARHVRTARIEASINAFAIAFSNALKTSPSIGKALARVQDVVSGPLSDELTLTLRELRLGTTVDQALLNLSTRVQSDRLDVLLGGVLIGRQVGGPIPTILETTAATFRELDRLHGVLRAKTSEGKGQVLIMALSPALIIFAFDALQPGYFEPLFSHVAGLAIVAVCSLSWLGSVLLARKILAVEI